LRKLLIARKLRQDAAMEEPNCDGNADNKLKWGRAQSNILELVGHLECESICDLPPTSPQLRAASSGLLDGSAPRRRALSLAKVVSASSRASRLSVGLRRARKAARATPTAPQGKAERKILLPEWYKSALVAQLETTLLFDDGATDHDVANSQMKPSLYNFSFPGSEAPDKDRIRRDLFEPLQRARPFGNFLPHARLSADASTQCEAEEMLEPMRPSPLGQKRCLAGLKSTPLEGGVAYSIATHFSLYEDPEVVAGLAADLDDRELAAVADRFLGEEIAGVTVEIKMRRPPRLVADRYVTEAVLIGQRAPAFREYLLSSARSLLLGSRHKRFPLNGRSLLRLADDDAEVWAKVAHTALNFACRLMQRNALPGAFAAEIIVVLADLSPTAVLLGLSTVLPAASASSRASIRRRLDASPWYCTCPSTPVRPPEGFLAQMRAWSTPAFPASPPPPLPMTRVLSMPAPPPVTMRDVGTSLRPQEAQPLDVVRSKKRNLPKILVHSYSSILVSKYADEVPHIEMCFLADYWLHAAGGEHSPAQLEDRARKAEEAALAESQLNYT